MAETYEHCLTPLQMVRAFHAKFGFTVNEKPTMVDERTWKIRFNSLLDETDELKIASHEEDLVAIADALGDILYLVYGTGVAYGIDLDAVFKEIHRSNMTKSPAVEKDGKAVKGEGYSPPNLERLLKKAGA